MTATRPSGHPADFSIGLSNVSAFSTDRAAAPFVTNLHTAITYAAEWLWARFVLYLAAKHNPARSPVDMIQGIYTAVQGMTPMMQKQDQIANNLANANTTGFKQSGLFIRSYQKYLENDQRQPFASQQIKADKVYVDFAEGTPRKTGGQLDLMIKGSGFFTLMTDEGVRYTRNGNFGIDKEGFLVAQDGSRVLSTEGFVRLDRGLPVHVSAKGEVMQGSEERAVLRIADFKKPYRMLREGESRFRPQLPDNPELKSPGFLLKQGYLEGSNVNVVRNMVQMISALRNFEAEQRALTAQDQTLDKAVNQVGRVG
jgi:flagellar basal-body rod protein FlgG